MKEDRPHRSHRSLRRWEASFGHTHAALAGGNRYVSFDLVHSRGANRGSYRAVCYGSAPDALLDDCARHHRIDRRRRDYTHALPPGERAITPPAWFFLHSARSWFCSVAIGRTFIYPGSTRSSLGATCAASASDDSRHDTNQHTVL